MLVIRKEQLERLHLSAYAHQLQRWAREFRSELPGETERYSGAGLEELLQRGSAAAEEYGFADEFLKREYLRVLLRTGGGEDGRPTEPRVRTVVEDPTLSPTEKMDRLAVLVPDPDRVEQNQIALAEAQTKRPVARPSPRLLPHADTEPDVPVEPEFFNVDGRQAPPEPDEMES